MAILETGQRNIRTGGSAKIVFIAPYEEIFAIGSRLIVEMGLSDRVEIYPGLHSQGLELARRAESEGADLIITRGGTAELIVKSGVQVPVIEIPLTVRDLADILLDARKASGVADPRVALIAYRNMMQHLETLSRMMDMRLEVYELVSESDISPAVEKAWHSGADVVIGGITTTSLAAARGMKTVILASGEDSCRESLLQAIKMSQVMSQEKERLQKFRVLVEYSVQGIIGTGGDGRITVFNESAEKLLARRAADVMDRDIDEVLPEIPVALAMASGKAILGQLVRIETHRFMANIVPIDVGKSLAGAMITIEDVGQILKMEAKVRSALYSRGLCAEYKFSDIFGTSPRILEARRIAAEYAATDSTILIYGESGTGKELFAQGIHNAGKRSAGPFVAVNCGAIPSSLLESELFGYEEGAFTGANRKGKPGLFELAHGGTIFLDEISELDKLAQTSLLRVIQERRVMRLGGDKFLPVDVRIITATNKNLAALIREGKFREDLYYRINVLPLDLPPLRDRASDSLAIAAHYLAEYNERYSRKSRLSPAAREFIEKYSWPGNLRQLRNYIERLVVTGKDDLVEVPLRVEDDRPWASVESPAPASSDTAGSSASDASAVPAASSVRSASSARRMKSRTPPDPRKAAVGESAGQASPPLDPSDLSCLTHAARESLSEKEHIIEVLALTGYNQKEASKLLGIDRSTLFRKMKAMNLEVRKSCAD